MKTKTSISVLIDLAPDFHAVVKARAQASAKTLNKYVKDTLEEREEEEDRYWGGKELKRLGKKVLPV